jgi:hypothetical protein
MENLVLTKILRFHSTPPNPWQSPRWHIGGVSETAVGRSIGRSSA